MGPKIFDRYQSEIPCQTYIHFQGVKRDQEINLVQSGHMKTAASYGYGPMIRDHFLLHFIKSGQGRLFINNRIYRINAGSCFLIYPHQIAYYEADANDPWEYYWIGLCGYQVENLLDQAGFSFDQPILKLQPESPAYAVLQDMIDHVFEEDNAMYLAGMLRILIHYLLRNRQSVNPDGWADSVEDPRMASRQANRDDEYVRIITSIIQTSYGQNISVEQIAEKLGLNRSYMTLLFRRHTGKSIRSYLTDYRIGQACILLRDISLSIGSIAGAVGYNDALYFTRAFTRLKGCSPRAYRQDQG